MQGTEFMIVPVMLLAVQVGVDVEVGTLKKYLSRYRSLNKLGPVILLHI